MTEHNGRTSEPILDPDLEIVDSHHHLFDRPTGRYMFEDYLADASAGHNIVASVYVETQAMARTYGPAQLRAIGEVEFANGVAAMSDSGGYGPCRVSAAIVGYADLTVGEPAGEFLDLALSTAPDRFRGVRQILIEHPSEAPYRYITHRPPSGLIRRPGLVSGLRELGKRELTFDAAVLHHQLPELSRLADSVPETTMILNHLGLAIAMETNAEESNAIFRSWRDSLHDLARRPNVVCKIGGLGLPFWGFGLESRETKPGSDELAEIWRPYVETAVEAFGADRCMMESNFPPDARSCGFVPLWNALKSVTEAFSASERTALFSRTARRVYRIPSVGQADLRGPRGRGPGASARPDAVTVQANAAATASAAANAALSSSSFTGVGQDDSFTTTTPRSMSM